MVKLENTWFNYQDGVCLLQCNVTKNWMAMDPSIIFFLSFFFLVALILFILAIFFNFFFSYKKFCSSIPPDLYVSIGLVISLYNPCLVCLMFMQDESNLYIFLELVTKGSLASLYCRYTLRDSQVSAYTRQILHRLKYLHDRNVVHRWL